MRYGKMTPKKQVLKGMIVEVLAADGHYATYKAVSDFLRVHWRGLMNSRRDPRDALNARIVLKSHTPPGALVWLPGAAFDRHIAARLQAVLNQRAQLNSAGTLASHPGASAAGVGTASTVSGASEAATLDNPEQAS